jgi:hypothetical protein
MQRNIHMHMAATYFNIGGVEEMGFTTWKRAMNQTLGAECNAVQTRLCGVLEIFTCHKEKVVFG